MSDTPKTYRLRVPAISTAWTYVQAESERAAMEYILLKLDDSKVWDDPDAWEIQEYKLTELEAYLIKECERLQSGKALREALEFYNLAAAALAREKRKNEQRRAAIIRLNTYWRNRCNSFAEQQARFVQTMIRGQQR